MNHISKYTIGGFPQSEAWEMTPARYKEFGEICVLLCSAKVQDRRRGNSRYYDFRRYFMKQFWDELISCLDIYRMHRGHKPISDIVAEIDREFKCWNPSESIPSSIDLPPVEKLKLEERKLDPKEFKYAEQLSLF